MKEVDITKSELAQINIWLSRKLAAQKLSVSEDTIDRRAVPYHSECVRGKIRYKNLELNPGAVEGRRYLESDLEEMLRQPATMEQPGRRTHFMRRNDPAA